MISDKNNKDISLNLLQKLAIIREKISVRKTGFNDYGNYTYYEIDEIYSQAKKLFLEYGIFTKFDLKYEKEIEQYRATLEVMSVDNPSNKFSMSIDCPLNNLKGSSAQQVGSNNTYQLKYLYMNLFMLDDGGNDPDSKNLEIEKKRPNYNQMPSTKKIDNIKPKKEKIKEKINEIKEEFF